MCDKAPRQCPAGETRRMAGGHLTGRPFEVVPVTKKEALAYAQRQAGYEVKLRRYLFAVGFAVGEQVLGIAVATMPDGFADDGWTVRAECYTKDPLLAEGVMLEAVSEAAAAMGYRRVETVDVESEVWTMPGYVPGREKPEIVPQERKRRDIEWQGAMGGWK